MLYLVYICVYAIFSDQSFDETLTNDTISFQQLGQDQLRDLIFFKIRMCTLSQTRFVYAGIMM